LHLLFKVKGPVLFGSLEAIVSSTVVRGLGTKNHLVDVFGPAAGKRTFLVVTGIKSDNMVATPHQFRREE
jgi:hypothetical protein